MRLLAGFATLLRFQLLCLQSSQSRVSRAGLPRKTLTPGSNIPEEGDSRSSRGNVCLCSITLGVEALLSCVEMRFLSFFVLLAIGADCLLPVTGQPREEAASRLPRPAGQSGPRAAQGTLAPRGRERAWAREVGVAEREPRRFCAKAPFLGAAPGLEAVAGGREEGVGAREVLCPPLAFGVAGGFRCSWVLGAVPLSPRGEARVCLGPPLPWGGPGNLCPPSPLAWLGGFRPPPLWGGTKGVCICP